jgi:hypothetical protein
MTGDPRLIAIERAVRKTALELLERDETVADIVAKLAVVSKMPSGISPREAAAAARRTRREEMLAELARYDREGRGRNAATLVARNFVVDRNDNIEVENLARQLRRWQRKKTDSVRFASKNQIRG